MVLMMTWPFRPKKTVNPDHKNQARDEMPLAVAVEQFDWRSPQKGLESHCIAYDKGWLAQRRINIDDFHNSSQGEPYRDKTQRVLKTQEEIDAQNQKLNIIGVVDSYHAKHILYSPYWGFTIENYQEESCGKANIDYDYQDAAGIQKETRRPCLAKDVLLENLPNITFA